MSAKERPILFSGAMVRALLAGAKTQTRRVVKPRHDWHVDEVPDERGAFRLWPVFEAYIYAEPETVEVPCPYGLPGDQLWVRETWHNCPHCGAGAVAYRAGGWLRRPRIDGPERDNDDSRPLNPKCAAHGWRPSIHMPRWASRLTLEVTGVRVERLQAITEADAKAEGAAHRIAPGGDLAGAFEAFDAVAPISYRAHFRDLWESINSAESWAANPWAWVVSFRRTS